MFKTPLNHAAADAAETLADRAGPLFTDAMERAAAEAEQFRSDMNDRMEIGTYFVAGAVVVGFICAALILRTTTR